MPNHNVLSYVMGFIIKKFSMNKGALTWFKFFGVMVRNLSIIETIFQWIFRKNQDWKLYWNMGAFLVLLEGPHQLLSNNVDFVILRPKMRTILLKY